MTAVHRAKVLLIWARLLGSTRDGNGLVDVLAAREEALRGPSHLGWSGCPAFLAAAPSVLEVHGVSLIVVHEERAAILVARVVPTHQLVVVVPVGLLEAEVSEVASGRIVNLNRWSELVAHPVTQVASLNHEATKVLDVSELVDVVLSHVASSVSMFILYHTTEEDARF
jgi:hypothetical protein